MQPLHKAVFGATITCIFTVIGYKLFDYIIKSQLLTGDLLESRLFQSLAPSDLLKDEATKEVARQLVKSIGEIIYNWTKVAIDKAVVISVIIGVIFMLATLTFFVLRKKEEKR